MRWRCCCSGCAPPREPKPAPPPNDSSPSENWSPCDSSEDAGATDLWVVDATDAVTLEVAAALNISRDLAASHVRYAHALRFSLPGWGGRSSPATSTKPCSGPVCSAPG